MKIRMPGCVGDFLRKWIARPDENNRTPDVGAPPVPACQTVTDEFTEAAPAHENRPNHNGRGIELPLKSILSSLPLELRSRLRHHDPGALTISISLERILPQLPRGAVKVSFGELRRAAPSLFSEEDDRDDLLVPLPLAEILPRLKPSLIACRRQQKQVEIPAEITSPFDLRNGAVIFSVGPTKPQSSLIPCPRQVEPLAPPPVSVSPRGGVTSVPTPLPPTAAPELAGATARITPPRPPHESGGNQARAPEAPAPPHPQPTGERRPLLLKLSLAEGWPEAVRRELVQLSLSEAMVALPDDAVERALKQGKVAFTWKTLRSWIKPSPLPTVSAHDNLLVELPLRIVVPPFLARPPRMPSRKRKSLWMIESPTCSLVSLSRNPPATWRLQRLARRFPGRKIGIAILGTTLPTGPSSWILDRNAAPPPELSSSPSTRRPTKWSRAPRPWTGSPVPSFPCRTG